jgi:hypothetical protein
MHQKRLPYVLVSLGVMLLLACAGCSGGGGDSNGGGTGQTATSQASTRTNQAVDLVLEILFGEDTGVSRSSTQPVQVTRLAHLTQVAAESRQTETVNLTLSCDPGQVSFNGTVTVEEGETADAFEITGTFGFNNCEGISGTLRFTSTGTVSSSQISIEVTLNGALNVEGCTVGFTAFSFDTTANAAGMITSPIIANGTISATCGGDSATCTLNNVDVSDVDAFENSCQSS